MNDLTAVRLYFPQAARAKATRFWHHLTGPTLSNRILAAAHKAGIHQALVHSVHSGYLPGKRMSHQQLESVATHHPLCMELIDKEHLLKKFLNDHAAELHNVRVVLFRCELPTEDPVDQAPAHAAP